MRALTAWIVLSAGPGAIAQAGDPVAIDILLARASRYVAGFIERFSNVVSEEYYVQESNTALPTMVIPGLSARGGLPIVTPRAGSARRRELRADFLIVKSGGDDVWQPFRDVFEVDGVAIRDREERLTRLFLQPSADGEARARRIAEESSRFNLGNLQRTINSPTFALAFLQPGYQARFRFTPGGPDSRAGADVQVVEFVEESRPTVIQGPQGRAMPAHGRFWIEAATGRVVRSEMLVTQSDVKARVTATFDLDERVKAMVPTRMDEAYDLSGSHITGTATYGRFRQFAVTATEELSPADPQRN
jgi:hypothetical protein